jgi:hypothetical protein
MRTLIAIAAVLGFATGAEAYCPPVPDTAETGYSQNNLHRTLCLQNELVQSANSQANKALIDLKLQQLQRDMLQQKFQLQQLQTFGTPNYLLPKL